MRGVSGDHAESFFCSGVRIDEVGPDAAVELLCDSRFGVARRTHLCNAYTLSVALRDVSYRQLLNASDINFADGHYVAMVGRWRGNKVMHERVYGPTLMLRTVDAGRQNGLRHYLYGASTQTVTRLASALKERYPGADIVGVESPPFRPLTAAEEEALVERVQAAKPDIFWVGLGTPRQDTFVGKYAERLGCTLVPVGAAFDFNSGNKPSAPPLAQRLGMEWAYRFATEPIRLWRRYMFGIPVFIVGVATDRWFRRRPTKGVSHQAATPEVDPPQPPPQIVIPRQSVEDRIDGVMPMTVDADRVVPENAA